MALPWYNGKIDARPDTNVHPKVPSSNLEVSVKLPIANND